MKTPFNQDTPNYQHGATDTPYTRAQKTWDERLGTARSQAFHWRLIAFIAILIALISTTGLIINLNDTHTKVFVAQIGKQGQVVNIAPLQTHYTPKLAEKAYFINQFITLSRSLPLDPVLAKQQWLKAYSFLTQNSVSAFNTMMQKLNYTNKLGNKTVTVNVTQVNPVSGNTFEVSFDETITDLNSHTAQTQHYSGIVTLSFSAPKTEQAILNNPLGIHIEHFQFKPSGSAA